MADQVNATWAGPCIGPAAIGGDQGLMICLMLEYGVYRVYRIYLVYNANLPSFAGCEDWKGDLFDRGGGVIGPSGAGRGGICFPAY